MLNKNSCWKAVKGRTAIASRTLLLNFFHLHVEQQSCIFFLVSSASQLRGAFFKCFKLCIYISFAFRVSFSCSCMLFNLTYSRQMKSFQFVLEKFTVICKYKWELIKALHFVVILHSWVKNHNKIQGYSPPILYLMGIKEEDV